MNALLRNSYKNKIKGYILQIHFSINFSTHHLKILDFFTIHDFKNQNAFNKELTCRGMTKMCRV